MLQCCKNYTTPSSFNLIVQMLPCATNTDVITIFSLNGKIFKFSIYLLSEENILWKSLLVFKKINILICIFHSVSCAWNNQVMFYFLKYSKCLHAVLLLTLILTVSSYLFIYLFIHVHLFMCIYLQGIIIFHILPKER